MPISAWAEESATSAICSTTSAKYLRGVLRTCQYEYHSMAPSPPSLNRWIIWRTHCSLYPTHRAISEFPTWPDDRRITLACKALTWLHRCRFNLWSRRRSGGDMVRTLTVLIWGPPCSKDWEVQANTEVSDCQCRSKRFTDLASNAFSSSETCELQTALAPNGWSIHREKLDRPA